MLRDRYWGNIVAESAFRHSYEAFPSRYSEILDKPLCLLYCKSPYDYRNRRRGLSIEEVSFFHTFLNMPINLIRLDPDLLIREYGKRRFAEILKLNCHWSSPDIALFSEKDGELADEIEYISAKTETTTINWTCDDQWAFDKGTGPIARYFNYVITTDPEGISKYQNIGYKNVIQSMWACNHFLFKPIPLEKDLDVIFVGQVYGRRERIIAALKKKHLNLTVFGHGSKGGRLTFRELVCYLNRAKICINFSEASEGNQLQFKARIFEAIGCGTLMLTEYLPGIEKYYMPGEEIDTWRSEKELIDKIDYYLTHDDKRKNIETKGYSRTINEHTYVHRFCHAFGKIGRAHV